MSGTECWCHDEEGSRCRECARGCPTCPTYRFECEDCNRTWSGKSASRCPHCNCGRVFIVKDGGVRVPV